MPTALVVTGDSAELAMIAGRILNQKGYRVAVAGVGPAGRLLRLSRCIRSYTMVCATRKDMEEAGQAVVETTRRLAEKLKAELLFAADTPACFVVNGLRALLPKASFFPCPAAETVRLLDNKWTFYQLMTELAVPSPKSWLAQSLAQAQALPRPLVLKPLSLAGGLGVHVVRDAARLDFLLSGGDPYLRMPVLAQEFMEGEDVGLSLLAENGRLNAWAVQIRRPDGTLDFIDDERPVEFGRRLAAATNYTGLAHIDMRYEGFSRAAVKVIEFNPRLWGSLPFTLGLDIDFVGRDLEMAAGRVPAPISQAPTGQCPALGGSIRHLLAGNLSFGPEEKVYLGHILGDPVPTLYKKMCNLLGIKNDDTNNWTV
ncbi:MAG: ATP-grasp domain-containing protein [Elusimicrobiota bacterium]